KVAIDTGTVRVPHSTLRWSRLLAAGLEWRTAAHRRQGLTRNPCWPAAARRLRRAWAASRSFAGPARTANMSRLPDRTLDTSTPNPLARTSPASPRALASEAKLPTCTHQLPAGAGAAAGAGFGVGAGVARAEDGGAG